MTEYLFGILCYDKLNPLDLRVLDEVFFNDVSDGLFLVSAELSRARGRSWASRLRHPGCLDWRRGIFRLATNYEERSERKQCRDSQNQDFAFG
jgi:hypothetical protein